HEGVRCRAEIEIDLPDQHVLVQGGGAPVRHEWEAGASLLLEVDTGDLPARANSTRGSLARVLLEPRDEFIQVVRGESLSRKYPLRGVCQQRHRFEILHYVILELIARAVEDVRAPMADAHCVAIGCRARDPAHANAAARPGHVLDDHGLTER